MKITRIFFIFLFLVVIATCVRGQSLSNSYRYQKGYVKKDGSVVKGHYKTNKNRTNHDNYSVRENVNPFTYKVGKRAKDYSRKAYNYGRGRDIKTGSRGGQYYINDKGNKVYVPKRR